MTWLPEVGDCEEWGEDVMGVHLTGIAVVGRGLPALIGTPSSMTTRGGKSTCRYKACCQVSLLYGVDRHSVLLTDTW